MQYRRLGNSGLHVSVLSYGAWVTFTLQMHRKLASQCMSIAYDAGVNFFDNAETYANGEAEVLMGKILKAKKWRRDSYIISSKAYFGCTKEHLPTQVGLSRKHLVEACHQALQRLQLDYLDLYFCHRPDPNTPISEIVETMTNLIRSGHILYWGTSEWQASAIKEAYDFAITNHLVPPLMEQPQYNMLSRSRVEQEYKELYASIGLGTTVWSPLASGLLTGKYNDGIPDHSRLSLPGYEWLKKMLLGRDSEKYISAIKEIEKVATSIGTSLVLFSIAWCARNPHVSTVITGASSAKQVQYNMQALDILPKLTDEVMRKVSNILGDLPEPSLP